MLQKLSAHIAACHTRAADCRRRADQANDAGAKSELLDLEQSWRHLASSYEFVESVERFLLSAGKHPCQDIASIQDISANEPTSPNHLQQNSQQPDVPRLRHPDEPLWHRGPSDRRPG